MARMTRGMRFAVTMVALALWAAVTVAAAAAPGDLDPSFGAGGKALVNLGGDDSAAAVALQPDGAILVAGSSQVGADPSVAVVARLLNPRGALDPSYGGGSGWSKMDFLNGGDRANAIALQPDGRILVAGSSEDATGPNPAGVVARLRNPEGTLDGTYGGGSGWSRIDLDGEETLNTIALQPDGAIVAGGRTSVGSTGDATVVRLRNPEGTFDSSYGGGSGWSRLALGGLGESDAIALQPDGRIVVVGTLSPLVGADLTVSRLVNPQGTFDPTFGAGTGVVVVDVNQYDLGAALALQPDGKILVAATTGGMSPGSHAVLVMRFLPDGGPDPAFGTGGRALLEAAGGADASAMVLQPDGKILLAGADFTAARNAFVRRLQPNGSPDTTFASGGRATLDFGGNDNASSLALQPDGAIVVAGSTTANGGEIAVARLQGDPRPPAGAAPGPVEAGPAHPRRRGAVGAPPRSSGPRRATRCAARRGLTSSSVWAATTASSGRAAPTSSAAAPATTCCPAEPDPTGSSARLVPIGWRVRPARTGCSAESERTGSPAEPAPTGSRAEPGPTASSAAPASTGCSAGRGPTSCVAASARTS